MEDYVKTGEDKNYEYYRNDSEVLSGDGEEEPYEEIYNKKEEFNIKIADNELKVKKRSIDKIMILSDNQPEEQILFSLYKTVPQGQSHDQIKTKVISNDKIRPNNPSDLDSLRGSKAIAFTNINSPEDQENNEPKMDNENQPKIEEKKDEEQPQPEISSMTVLRSSPPQENPKNTLNLNVNTPLGGEMVGIGNNNNSNENSNVINVPNNEGSDNEEVTFKKGDNIDNLIVGLPPQAVRTKWFYLLLALDGIGEIIIFIAGLLNAAVGFALNMLCLGIIGAFLIFTGIFGFNKINNKIYNNNLLQICTIACMILGALGAVLIIINPLTSPYFIIVLILGILNIIFSILCIIWTKQLKTGEENVKQKQMELLVDDKK